LWEQKLEGMIRVAGVTGFGSAGSSVVVPGPTPGPDGPGSEPAPPPVVDPDPSTPRIPSTPIVAGTTLGLSITWDGKDTTGVLFPRGTTVEVHVSGTTGFTPSSGTLKGAITEAGGSLLVGGIAAGATFFVKFIAVYADGQKSDPSAQGSAMVGLVQGPEINGDAVITQIVAAVTPVTTYKLGSIWINTSNGTYNVLQDVGGTPTWVKREWDTAAIAANAITANQIAAQAITAKLVSGEVIRTTTGDIGARVRLSSADGVEVYSSAGRVFHASPTGTVTISGYLTATDVGSSGTTTIDGGRITSGTIIGRTIQSSGGNQRIVLANGDTIDFYFGGVKRLEISSAFMSGTSEYRMLLNGGIEISAGGFYVFGANVDMPGASGNAGATTADVGFNGNRLRAKTSNQNLKYDIAVVDGDVSGVDEARKTDVVTVDPADVLKLGVVEFSWLEQGEPTEWRELGFIAQDVAEKFPIAASVNDSGEAVAVRDTPLIAALLTVVREQQSVIADLTARIEALESNQG